MSDPRDEPLEEERDVVALERVLQGAPGAGDDELALAVARLRRALADERVTAAWSARREARLVHRVLARTTREDLSWRGELALLAEFVRERLATSPLLRILAAGLLLLLLGGPPIVWWIYRERAAPSFVAGIEPAPGTPRSAAGPGEPPAPAASARPAHELDPRAGTGVPAERIENALRRARFALGQGRPRADAWWSRHGLAPEAASVPAEIELLSARSRWLAERAWSELLDDRETLERADVAELTLLADACLDRFAQTEQRAALTDPVLRALARAASAAVGPAAHARANAVLDRARAYGLWEAPPGFDPEGVPAPLGAEDLGSLRAMLAEAGIARERLVVAR